MEINKENIADVLKSDEYKNEILPLITASDTVQSMIGNKATSMFEEKISTHVAGIYKKDDDDIFETLGVKPKINEDGSKQKTNDLKKELFLELKELRGQKESLTKDEEVKRLNGEIEKLKTEGGGAQVQAILDQARLDWKKTEEGYLKKINDAGADNESFKKEMAISTAFTGIKWNPDTDETVKNIVVKNAKAELMANSELKDGKLMFLNAEGKPVLNEKWEPKTASEMLASMEAIKAISLKEVKPGGNAKPTITGSIQTINVEGKDVKTLTLQEGSFKTKEEFQKVAQKAMLDSGVARRDKDWNKILDKAYLDYNVKDLPRQ